MVTSADKSSRPPDPAPVPAPAAREATPPRAQAPPPASLLPAPSFPILKSWGSRRVLPCVSVDGKGEIVGGGGRRKTAEHDEEKAGRRVPVPEDDGDDPRIEEVREKLLLHLREAADRMKLAPFFRIGGMSETDSDPSPEPEPSNAVEEPPAAPRWNLRTRRRAPRSPTENHRHVSGSLPATREKTTAPRSPTENHRHLCGSPPGTREKRAVRLRSEEQERAKRPKFSISLTKEEIDEDLYSITGSRARRRPRRRPRTVQKLLDSLFPGSCLSEITADSYKVPDEK
ncbi:uncharacterized protein LOC141820693 [Curcuma longa]|uniref:uncharacterized protein LOC141820693 n=1 Tax=Curcuma longa TaxID=136217 RepID=UPI003D9F233C